MKVTNHKPMRASGLFDFLLAPAMDPTHLNLITCNPTPETLHSKAPSTK